MLRPALQYRPEDRGFLLCLPEAASAAAWQRVLRGLPGNLQGRERLTPAKARIFQPDGTLMELHAVPLRWQRALPWLASMPPTAEGSLAFWAASLRLLQSLVIRGALLPALETEENPWRATWGISLTSPSDRKAMERLLRAMPPSAIAFPEGDNWLFTKGLGLGALEPFEVDDDLALPPPPEKVLKAFLEDGADFVMRFVAGNLRPGEDPRLAVIHRLRGHKRDRLPWDERILVALSHPMSEFPTVGVTERTLGEQMEQWSEGARDPWVRPSLRLEAPPVPQNEAIQEADRLSEEGWTLRVGLETADGAEIPVARLWEPSTEPSVLQARQALLRGLARAVPFFPPVEGALSGQKPEDLKLKPTEAWLFLTKGAAQLKEAGFLVDYPEELAEFGGARRLRAKVRLGARQVADDGESPGQAGLQGSVSADWSLMLGDDKLEIEDFAQMASLKHPLVAWKGKWVALDPETLKQITQVIQASRGAGFESMTKGEALAAALTGTARIPGVSEAIEVEVAGDFGSALAELRNLPDKPIKQPRDFHGQLRPYQVRGLAWLDGLSRLGLGGILADDMGLGKCVSGEARVHTLEGPVAIEQLWNRPLAGSKPDGTGGEWATLQEPIEIQAFTGDNLCNVRVDTLYRERISAPLVQVTLQDGSEVRVSQVHRFLTSRGWKQARELVPGERVAVAARTEQRGQANGLSPALAELMAWHLAEGYEREEFHNARFTNSDPKVMARVRELAHGLGVDLPEARDHRGRGTQYLTTNRLHALFSPWGYAWGRLSRAKAIPEAILRGDPQVQRAFLQAYFDAEGHVGRTHCELSTASRDISEGLRLMFRNFGIWLRIRCTHKAATNGRNIKRPYFVCTFGGNDLPRFSEQFTLLSGEKRLALRRLLRKTRNTNIEGVPAQDLVADIERNAIPLRSVGLRSVYRHQGMGRILARDVSTALEQQGHSGLALKLRQLSADSLNWCPVKAVETTPFEGFVYDISVPDLHNYVVEGMVTHNTIEVIALLLHRQQQNASHGPTTLLICPTSLLGNWERELAKFSPSIPFFVHHGNNRDPLPKHFAPHTVVLTTYGVVRREEETFAARTWGMVVVDEAQAIKNAGSAQAKAIRRLKGHFKLALTGTPIENRLLELWSIMGSALPGYLASESNFKEQFATPIEKYRDADAATELRQRVGPFILRRLKTDKSIIQDLPEKQEMKVYTSLTREQALLYQARVDQMEQDLDKASGIERRGRILALLTHLKQICNHPSQFLRQQGPYAGRSGKLERLTEMLEEVLESGERALIFTQFKEMGDRLQLHFQEALGFEPPFLHGGTTRKDRDELVRGFQEDPGFSPVFILSLKAGGVGLNLTAATHVFHFDRWWNPAVEDQATDRTYRIGQTRNVQVHKLITIGTLEEKIDLLLESKRDLADRVVGSGEGWLTELDDEALRRLVSLDPDVEILDSEGGPSNLDEARRALPPPRPGALEEDLDPVPEAVAAASPSPRKAGPVARPLRKGVIE